MIYYEYWKGKGMKNKIYYALAIGMLLLTPVMVSVAEENTWNNNGVSNSNGRIVYQQNESTLQEIVYDITDLQTLYNLAR